MVQAVVFDMDGVLVDTERDWDPARHRVAEASGGRWRPGATTDMIGMSSAEWSRYIHDELGVEAEPEAISRRVVAEMLGRVASGAPLLPGASAAVESLAVRWPLALASPDGSVLDARPGPGNRSMDLARCELPEAADATAMRGHSTAAGFTRRPHGPNVLAVGPSFDAATGEGDAIGSPPTGSTAAGDSGSVAEDGPCGRLSTAPGRPTLSSRGA